MLRNKQRISPATEANIYFAYTVYIKTGVSVKTKYSESCFTVTGYTPQEFSDDPDLWINMVSEEDRDLVRQQEAHILSGHFSQPIEYRITRKDGIIRWIDFLVIPQYDIEGNLISYSAILRDITESKKAEKNLYTYAQGLAALLEVNKSIAATLDLQNVLQASVNGVTKMIGLDTAAVYLLEDEMLHLRATTPPLPLQYPDELRIAPLADHAHIRKAISSGKPVFVSDIMRANLTPAERFVMERRNLRTTLYVPLIIGAKAIGVFIVSSVGKPLPISDTVIDLSCTLANLAALAVRNAQLYRDGQKYAAELEQTLAERKKLLKTLSAKNNELQSIVYVASHDLRSPLVNIEGFGGELTKTCLDLKRLLDEGSIDHDLKQKLISIFDDSIPDSIKFIKAGTAKMSSLLAGLLQVSRVGTKEVEIKPLDINRMMHDIRHSIEFQIKEVGAELAIEELSNCLGDGDMVNQAFSNLIGNALKYLDLERKGKIHISGRTEDGMSIYCVEDNGIGIAPEHQDNIFELFHRLDPADTAGGEGLGLTIVTRILDRLNGNITVESELGKGSKFFISLPTVKA